MRTAGWVEQLEYPDSYIAPKPPRSLTYEELTSVRLYMANAENWRQVGDRYNHREFMPLRELMSAAGVEDLGEGSFKRALKPLLVAFVPSVTPGARTFTNQAGEPETLDGLIATLIATPEEQIPVVRSRAAWATPIRQRRRSTWPSSSTFFLLALAGRPDAHPV